MKNYEHIISQINNPLHDKKLLTKEPFPKKLRMFESYQKFKEKIMRYANGMGKSLKKFPLIFSKKYSDQSNYKRKIKEISLNGKTIYKSNNKFLKLKTRESCGYEKIHKNITLCPSSKSQYEINSNKNRFVEKYKRAIIFFSNERKLNHLLQMKNGFTTKTRNRISPHGHNKIIPSENSIIIKTHNTSKCI